MFAKLNAQCNRMRFFLVSLVFSKTLATQQKKSVIYPSSYYTVLWKEILHMSMNSLLSKCFCIENLKPTRTTAVLY